MSTSSDNPMTSIPATAQATETRPDQVTNAEETRLETVGHTEGSTNQVNDGCALPWGRVSTDESMARQQQDGESLTSLPDADLLERFALDRDEVVFAVLVHRHASLVMAVCRRSISDEHLAEDAFQATFMVLAKRAGRIKKQESLASWLYGTAWRISLQTLRTRLKRREQEITDPVMVSTDPLQQVAERFEQQVVDEELAALPAEYRSAVVMHDVLGKPCSEIAQELGVTTGTVEGNLKRGRRQLRMQLARRGISLSIAAALITGTLKSAEAAASASLLNATVAASVSYAGGTSAAAATVTTASTQLAAQELALMTITKSLIGSIAISATVFTAVGIWSTVASSGPGASPGTDGLPAEMIATAQDEPGSDGSGAGEVAGAEAGAFGVASAGGLSAADNGFGGPSGGNDAEDEYGAGFGAGGAEGVPGMSAGGRMMGSGGQVYGGAMQAMNGVMGGMAPGMGGMSMGAGSDMGMGIGGGMGASMGMEDDMFGGYPGGMGPSSLPPGSAFQTHGKGRSAGRIGPADFGSVNTANQAIQSSLDQPVKGLDFPGENPLSEVLMSLQDQADSAEARLRILPDRAVLRLHDMNSLDEVMVNDIFLEGVTKRTALKLVLSQTDDPALTYVVSDECLLITSVEAAEAMRVVEFYDLSGLIQPGNELGLQWVAQTIRTLISDENAQWEETGGDGSIALYPRGLIIRQNPKVHERIADLLQRLEQQMAPPPNHGVAGGMMGGGMMGSGSMGGMMESGGAGEPLMTPGGLRGGLEGAGAMRRSTRRAPESARGETPPAIGPSSGARRSRTSPDANSTGTGGRNP